MADTEEKCVRRLKHTFVWKAFALVSLKKTELTTSLSISVALATVALGPPSGAEAWMGTVGRVAFPDEVFPLIRTHFQKKNIYWLYVL
jgi:hypothetical protein